MLFAETKLNSQLTHPDYPGVTITVIAKDDMRITVATNYRMISFYKSEFEAQPFGLVEEKPVPKKHLRSEDGPVSAV